MDRLTDGQTDKQTLVTLPILFSLGFANSPVCDLEKGRYSLQKKLSVNMEFD